MRSASRSVTWFSVLEAAFKTAAMSVPAAIRSATPSVRGTAGGAPSAITLPVNIPSAGAMSVKGRASSQARRQRGAEAPPDPALIERPSPAGSHRPPSPNPQGGAVHVGRGGEAEAAENRRGHVLDARRRALDGAAREEDAGHQLGVDRAVVGAPTPLVRLQDLRGDPAERGLPGDA